VAKPGNLAGAWRRAGPWSPGGKEDHFDVGELAEPVGGSLIQNLRVQDQSRHYGAPVVLDDLGPAAADHADRGQRDGLSHPYRPGRLRPGAGAPRTAAQRRPG